MHLDEEQIQRLVHGELLGRNEPLFRDHLGGCSECRSRLDQAEGEEAWMSQRLRQLDHGPPHVSLESVLAHRGPQLPAWGRWAAGFILALGAAGAAYAVPGSPLPRLLERIINSSHREAPTGRRLQGPAAAGSGIALDPGRRLIIAFQADSARDTALVSLARRADVVVQARGGAISFGSEPERLSIRNQGAATWFEITIPHSARSVEIRSGGRPIWSKQGSRIGSDAHRDAQGRYILLLDTARP